jgi:hypothetical protein
MGSTAQHKHANAGRIPAELRKECRLAETGFAGDEHNGTIAGLCGVDPIA